MANKAVFLRLRAFSASVSLTSPNAWFLCSSFAGVAGGGTGSNALGLR